MTDDQLKFGLLILGGLLSVYGAGLSTFNFWQARRKEQRRAQFFFEHENRIDDNSSCNPLLLVVRLVNIGERPFLVRSIELFCRDSFFDGIDEYTPQQGFVEGENSPFPIEVTQAHQARASFLYTDMQWALRKIGEKGRVTVFAQARLSTGELLKSELQLFDIEACLYPNAVTFD